MKLCDFMLLYILTLKNSHQAHQSREKSAIPHSLKVVKNERKKNRVMSESLEGMKTVTEYNEVGGRGTATNSSGRLYILYYNPSATNDKFRVPVDFDTDSINLTRSS